MSYVNSLNAIKELSSETEEKKKNEIIENGKKRLQNLNEIKESIISIIDKETKFQNNVLEYIKNENIENLLNTYKLDDEKYKRIKEDLEKMKNDIPNNYVEKNSINESSNESIENNNNKNIIENNKNKTKENLNPIEINKDEEKKRLILKKSDLINTERGINLVIEEILKINDSKIAYRTKNEVFVVENNNQNKLCSYNEHEILFFCSYQNEHILWSLENYSNKNKCYIVLFDLKKNIKSILFALEEKIVYLYDSNDENQFFSIGKPNLLYCFKNRKEVFKQEIEKEIQSLIKVSENVLFFANTFGYFFYDKENKKILFEYFEEQEILSPKDLCLMNNYLLIAGINHLYILNINDYKDTTKISINFITIAFCKEVHFVCFFQDDVIELDQFNPDLRNVRMMDKKENYKERVKHSIFKNSEELLVLTGNNMIQYFDVQSKN